MGAPKRDRRIAKFQEEQRRAAAKAKADKEQQKRDEASGDPVSYDWWKVAVVPASQPYHVQPGHTYRLNFGGPVAIAGNTVGASVTKVEPLPKSESTELITGYRMWYLHRSFPDGYRLVPMNKSLADKVLPNEKLTAKCQAGGASMSLTSGGWYTYDDPAKIEPAHTAPHEGCNCGIHAYKTSVPLEPSDKPYAAGEVYMWGRVIEHEKGYRAEFAYPKKLYVIDGGPRADKIADALAWTYGVPCEVWDG